MTKRQRPAGGVTASVGGDREAKSLSAEETFGVDLTDRARLDTEIQSRDSDRQQ